MWCLHVPSMDLHRIDDDTRTPLPLGMRRAVEPQMHPAARRSVALTACAGLALLALVVSGCAPVALDGHCVPATSSDTLVRAPRRAAGVFFVLRDAGDSTAWAAHEALYCVAPVWLRPRSGT